MRKPPCCATGPGRPFQVSLLALVAISAASALGQTPQQPKVNPGAGEPDWNAVLSDRYGLSLFGDLCNPVKTTAAETPGLFRKAGPGPVSYTPVIALGLTTRNHGGWYLPAAAGGEPRMFPLWTYTFKNSADDLKTDKNLPPPLEQGADGLSTRAINPLASGFPTRASRTAESSANPPWSPGSTSVWRLSRTRP